MKCVFLSLCLAVGVLAGVSIDRLFYSYAHRDDRTMEVDEFGKWVMHFDTDGNGNVSKGEFDSTWKREDLGDEKRAPLFFLELDRVPDEVLNSQDVPHIFRLFDEDGSGHITYKEFRFNWDALFDD